MTAPQMICHLSDAFCLALGEKQARALPVPVPRAVFKFVALRVPIAWPKGLPTLPEVEQGAGGTPPAEFEPDRERLLVLLQRFCEPGRSFKGIAHPMFGQMTPGDWLRWGYLHTDHHLRQFGV